MPQPTTSTPPLAQKLTVLDAAKSGFDASIPFAERINTLTAQSTQALGDPVMRDNPAKQTAYDAEAKFPFTPEAKTKLADLKIKGVLPGKGVTSDNRVEGEYRVKGKGIYEGVHKVLPATLSAWVAHKLGGLDAPSITVQPEGDNTETIAAHEMLHHLAQSGPINDPQTAVSWLNTWDALKKSDQDVGPLLSGIDKHYMSSGYSGDANSIAQERFAYLGEMALKHGINVIPKELQPFYHGIVEGAPAPTDAQRGTHINPDAGFEINMESRFSDSPGGKAINYILGRTEVDNTKVAPPAPAPKQKAAPQGAPLPDFVAPKGSDTNEARKAILGTLFAEVSNRSPEKQMLEAQTILNTARNRAKERGTTVLQEITRAMQYQGYGSKEYKRYASGKTKAYDKQKIDSISKVYDDLVSGKVADNTKGSTNYIHIVSGPHTGSIVYMSPKEFNTYYKKRGKARDAYAATLIGG